MHNPHPCISTRLSIIVLEYTLMAIHILQVDSHGYGYGAVYKKDWWTGASLNYIR